MFRRLRETIGFSFRWGEHTSLTLEIAELFGLKKVIIASLAGVLTTLEAWRESVTSSPIVLVLIALGVISAILLIINISLRLYDRLKTPPKAAKGAKRTKKVERSSWPSIVLAGALVVIFMLIWNGYSRDSASAKISLLQIVIRAADEVKFDYYVKNVGTVPAIAFVHNESSALPDQEKDDSETDRAFDALKLSVRIPEWEKATSEIPPGDTRWFTFLYKLTKEQYEQVTSGPKYLYHAYPVDADSYPC